MKSRRIRQAKINTTQTIIIILLLAAILSVMFLLVKLTLDDKDPGNLSRTSNGSAGTSSSNDVQSGSLESQPANIDPVTPTGAAVFWGDNIDLKSPINKIDVPGKHPKWPSEPGFTVPDKDFSLFKANADSAKPLTGAVIYIDPGHGGEDLGAVYPRAPIRPEIIERNVNLEAGFYLKNYLEKAGARVVMTREKNDIEPYPRLYIRSAIVAKDILEDFYSKLSSNSPIRSEISSYISKMDDTIKRNLDDDPADVFFPKGVNRTIKNIMDIQSGYSNAIFISLHCNSSNKPDSLKGTRVYYATNAMVHLYQAKDPKQIVEPEYQNYNDEDRKRLAEAIYSQITKEFPELKFEPEDQGVLINDYSVIRETNLVSALVEMAYVNHEHDRDILLNSSKLERIAKSIYDAIYIYFCH